MKFFSISYKSVRFSELTGQRALFCFTVHTALTTRTTDNAISPAFVNSPLFTLIHYLARYSCPMRSKRNTVGPVSCAVTNFTIQNVIVTIKFISLRLRTKPRRHSQENIPILIV